MDTHSQKIEYAKSDIATWLNMLSTEFDIMASIKQVGKETYQVVIDFEVVETFKQRRSARKYIQRLLNQKINES